MGMTMIKGGNGEGARSRAVCNKWGTAPLHARAKKRGNERREATACSFVVEWQRARYGLT